MKVAIFTIFSFPNGMAASNRIIAYSKGLISCGVDVHLICVQPNCSFTNIDREPDMGCFDKINYIYPSGKYKNKYKFIRAFSYLSKFRFFWGLFKSWQFIKQNKFDVAILGFDQPLDLFCYEKILRNHFKKILFVFDEYPIPIRHKLRKDIPQWKKMAYKYILPKIDGYISISKKLIDYYNFYAKKPSFLMPVIVDFNKFNVDVNPIHNTKIIYMGNMEQSKDNVELIISAFSRIEFKYPSLTLHLYGASNDIVKKNIELKVSNYHLNNKVFVHKRIKSNEVPKILSTAKILVSSQPNTKRASGGFPTKLGEYLSMGIPTLITDVGENSLYVKPNVHCFFAKPDNVDDYVRKLEYILNNYDYSLGIAKKGRDLIFQEYTCEVIGKKLKCFLFE